MPVSSPVLLVLVIQAFMVVLFEQCTGEVILTVSKYPARIYQGAPADIPVLTLYAYDNTTGVPVTNFITDTSFEATFFKVDSSGVIKTRRTIHFKVGHILRFLVAGIVNNQNDDKQVEIVVSVKNKHAPRFVTSSHSFIAYRLGIGDNIGYLEVVDEDEEEYNRKVTVFLAPGQLAAWYIQVDQHGYLRVIEAFPDHMTTFNVTILASDDGSPQFTSTVNIEIEIVKIRQPTIFCLSSRQTTVTLCWKNPMPLQHFNGYNLTVSGSTNRTVFLPAIEGHTESCFTENATGFGLHYVFVVTVPTTEPSFGGNLGLNFTKTKTGHSKQCEAEAFSICSYRNLCNDHGKCTTTSTTNYTCICDAGWQGSNCKMQDMCLHAPCLNNGDCEFRGNKDYICHCPSGYNGSNCQFPNLCLNLPCQNDGTCVTLENGTYRCDCRPQFTGKNCQTQDPCFPPACVANRGKCSRVSDKEYKCDCLKGYFGQNCEHKDACLLESEPCKSQGNCTSVGDSYICLCPPGTTGLQCQYFDPCFIEPCQNNGTCTNRDLKGIYKCQCLPGFDGNECQYQNICYGVNCNSGTCYTNSTHEARCQCFQGFYGTLCDKFNVCLTSPCNNHGTCNSSGFTSDYHTNFTCSCFEGWSGIDCSIINKCSLDVCKNGGTCQNSLSQGINCTCPEGYYLNDCSAFDTCSEHECQNGAVCQNISQEKYECRCQKDWLGSFCQYESPCSANKNPCQNGGQCQISKQLETSNGSVASTSTESYTSVCDCISGYSGETCQFSDPCSSSPCIHGDCQSYAETFESEIGDYVCLCFQNFTGRLCDLFLNLCQNVYCLNGGDCLDGVCMCPQGFTGPVCEQEISVCHEKDQDKPCIVDEAMQNLRGLLDVTSDPSKLSAEQVLNFTEQLLGLYNHTLRDPMYAWTAFCVLGNLAKVNTSVSEEVEGTGNVNTRLLEFLNNYTSEVRIEDSSGQINISAPELHVKVCSLQKMLELDNTTISFQPYTTDNNTNEEIHLEIRIPPDILTETSNGTEDMRIQFIGYKRSQLFVPVNGFPDDEYSQQSQPVISATIKGRELKNLTVPVEIRLLNITHDRNYTCVFWDPEGSRWSTEGVTMLSYDFDSVTCQSTHLTSFAILLDVNAERTVSEEHEKILTYLTYIGCAISTSCLVITIVTYALFKCLNNEKSGKILLQLCTALLLLNVAFLVGTVDVSGFSKEACLVVGMFLHFFLLCSLMWMLVEAVEMYQALVKVFSKYERLYLLKRCLLAWGIPVIIVAITAAVDSESYYNEMEKRQFCFLTSKSTVAYYTSLVAPSCAILLVNSFLFIMVARVILKPNFQKQLWKNTTSITPAQIRGAFTVMFLLGITWVFGPLAVNEAQTVFSYLFCICNSLQGFLIFVFRCLFNPEAKMAWLQLFYTGTLKSKRGPIKSVYTDSTSKGGDIRRPSTGNTSGFIVSSTSRASLNSKNGNGFHPHPHQLHTTNGWHPKLNGLRRDKTQNESKTSFNSSVNRIKEKQISSEYPDPTQPNSLPDEGLAVLQDEHLQDEHVPDEHVKF